MGNEITATKMKFKTGAVEQEIRTKAWKLMLRQFEVLDMPKGIDKIEKMAELQLEIIALKKEHCSAQSFVQSNNK